MNELQVLNENSELKAEQLSILEKSGMIVIKTNEDDAKTVLFVKGIKGLIEKIETEKAVSIDKAHKLHKGLVAEKNELVNPLKVAVTIINNKCIVYRQEVKLKIEEEEKKKIEQARLAEERRKKEIEEQARRAEEKGNTEKAEMLRDKKEEIFVQPKPVKIEIPKIQGSAMVDSWSAVVVDINLVPDIFTVKVADMPALNALGKSSKGKKEVPGVKFVNTPYMKTSRN